MVIWNFFKAAARLQKLFDISVLKEITEPKELVELLFEMEYILSHL